MLGSCTFHTGLLSSNHRFLKRTSKATLTIQNRRHVEKDVPSSVRYSNARADSELTVLTFTAEASNDTLDILLLLFSDYSLESSVHHDQQYHDSDTDRQPWPSQQGIQNSDYSQSSSSLFLSESACFSTWDSFHTNAMHVDASASLRSFVHGVEDTAALNSLTFRNASDADVCR